VGDDGKQISRRVHAHAAARTLELLDSPLFDELVRDGLLVGVLETQRQADGGLILLHRRIELPSYPFEWSPVMLADAARLTLEIQRRAWEQGWTLKDAAAGNVLFDGCRPIFCDLLSLRKREPSDEPGWVAYGQFVRHFALPLLAVTELGRMPRDIFLSHRDGLRAAEISAYIPWHAQFGLAIWLHLWLPARLERRRIRQDQRRGNVSRAGSADGTPWLLGNLLHFVDRLAGRCRGLSTWSEYTANREHYENAELEAKRTAIQALTAEGRHRHVLDIGANSGEFSLIAARAGCQVLALDDDANALHDLYVEARRQALPVQCLHANFAQPTPATGWQGSETLSLTQRFYGRFSLVLALAVVHHLTITERLPTQQLFEVLADCCTDLLLLEFVSQKDPRFIEIAGQNLHLYAHWDLPFVLRCAAPWFNLEHSQQISEHRTLLHLRRRMNSSA
jgi:hypothetical protein